MHYRKNDSNDIRHIILPGRVTSIDRIDFIEMIERFTQTPLKTLILDFTDTRMIDSAGLGMILITRQLVHDSKKKLILKNPTHHVKKVFEIMNFDNILTIEY